MPNAAAVLATTKTPAIERARRRWFRRDCWGRGTPGSRSQPGVAQRCFPFNGLPLETLFAARRTRAGRLLRFPVRPNPAQLEFKYLVFPRPQTYSLKLLNRPEVEPLHRPLPPLPRRSECKTAARPCPHVRCRYHLAIDTNEDNGSIKYNFPDVELKNMPATCSLDVADQGEHTLGHVARLLNISPEGLRRFECKIREKLHKIAPELRMGWRWDD